MQSLLLPAGSQSFLLFLGNLLTGDCKKNIHLWKPLDGSWVVDQRPFVGHTASVEDIQWSPNEPTVNSTQQAIISLVSIRCYPGATNVILIQP